MVVVVYAYQYRLSVLYKRKLGPLAPVAAASATPKRMLDAWAIRRAASRNNTTQIASLFPFLNSPWQQGCSRQQTQECSAAPLQSSARALSQSVRPPPPPPSSIHPQHSPSPPEFAGARAFASSPAHVDAPAPVAGGPLSTNYQVRARSSRPARARANLLPFTTSSKAQHHCVAIRHAHLPTTLKVQSMPPATASDAHLVAG